MGTRQPTMHLSLPYYKMKYDKINKPNKVISHYIWFDKLGYVKSHTTCITTVLTYANGEKMKLKKKL